jgi:hypothetical protein
MKELFEKSFKFKINDVLRHKADKNEHSVDAGLLVLSRTISEEKDDVFELYYECRIINYSGAGQIFRFHERELLTVEEYTLLKLNERTTLDNMHKRMKEGFKDIYDYFGVEEKGSVTLKDKEGQYKIIGCGSDHSQRKVFLKLRKVDNGNFFDKEEVELTDKDQISSKEPLRIG